MEDEDEHKELQLLPAPINNNNIPVHPSTPQPPPSIIRYSQDHRRTSPMLALVDLRLSISVNNDNSNNNNNIVITDEELEEERERERRRRKGGVAAALKWEAAEQIRMAAAEKAYAERVREMTRREMELAQSEFARARHVWQRAREDADRAERLKERATATAAAGACLEITCHSCRQRFRPN